jgi:hypothetical protein
MRCAAALSVLLLSISGAASAACPPPDPEIADAINQFMVDHTREEYGEFYERLLRQPKEAACQLVAELKLVDELRVGAMEQEEHPAAMRVVQAIRALRYITDCQDFTGRTKERLAAERLLPDYDTLGPREQFLLRDGRDNVPFFSVWMSHDSTFFAARDVQTQIIAQWKDWLDTIDEFEFGRCEDPNDWYF